MAKCKFYFDYLPKTKSGFGKRKSSACFSTLSRAKAEALKRYRAKKIVQAQLWDASNPINHKIVGSLNTKGKFQGRRYS